jgi:hypothetical protein
VAKFAATDYQISIDEFDFSTNLNSVELSIESDDLETTTFGKRSRTRIGGLRNATLTLNFMQDFEGLIDGTMTAFFGQKVPIELVPTAGSVTATNPKYSFECLVTQYSPFASSVGDLATFSVTWPVTGPITRGTA